MESSRHELLLETMQESETFLDDSMQYRVGSENTNVSVNIHLSCVSGRSTPNSGWGTPLSGNSTPIVQKRRDGSQDIHKSPCLDDVFHCVEDYSESILSLKFHFYHYFTCSCPWSQTIFKLIVAVPLVPVRVPSQRPHCFKFCLQT
jgi:hypothetical protein